MILGPFLLQYPEFFSFGVFTKVGPTRSEVSGVLTTGLKKGSVDALK